MREFIRHCRAAWIYGKRFPYIPEADESWTDDDAKIAKGFFASGPGYKLAMRIRNFSVQSAMTACAKPNGDHANGVAAGIAMTASMIDSHTQCQVEENQELKVVNL